MFQANGKSKPKRRRSYSEEFKQEAVQILWMVIPGAPWRILWDCRAPMCCTAGKRKAIGRGGPAARTLDDRVSQLQEELQRVEREHIQGEGMNRRL